MMRRTLFTAIAALAVCSGAAAQQLVTYTQSETGPNLLTYGLPVPQPIDSLTPVDGFRSYASIEARLQGLALSSADLTAHDIGRTTANRVEWAYVVSDADGVDVEGRPEAAFFINASTHAREWGAPEVSTGTIELLLAGAGDNGLMRYLLDNTRLVTIPVHNIDGALQTQRYPTQALVGADPHIPGERPRDGRMRRKNMRGVDEVLTTLGDHLNGVDLNRNHPPFWATSPQSSANPASLVFRGGSAHSEPENTALLAAAQLGPETRFRLGIDVHSFSKVFFSSNTARTRLNTIQTNLISRLRGHHAALSGKFYTDVRDPPNQGIGAAAEYFAYQWLVPSWTLELEPSNDASEYGGTNVTHGGFILPAAEARRVRESWAQTHAVAFYQMAGPPHLSRLRFYDVASGALALETRWVWNPQTGARDLVASVPGSLAQGRRYRAELGFSKPMRHRDAQGQIAPLPGFNSLGTPQVTLIRDATRTSIDTAGGAWIDDSARVLRYRDDTFAFEFDAPADLAAYNFEVIASDMSNLQLDANPATPADWAEGAWSEYENAAGADSDFGGADRTRSFTVAAAAASQVTLLSTATAVGEGDSIELRVTRAAGNAGALELRRLDVQPAAVVASWAANEAGERSFVVDVAENTALDGDRMVNVALGEFANDVAGATRAVALRVLDNDDAERVVWTVRNGANLVSAWDQAAQPARAELVLSGTTTYTAPFYDGGSPPNGLTIVRNDLTVSGNGASIAAASLIGSRLLLNDAQGHLTLDRVHIAADLQDVHEDEAIIENDGELRIVRSTVRSEDALDIPLIRNRGTLSIERSGLRASIGDGAIVDSTGGVLQTSASTLYVGNAAGADTGNLLRLAGTTASARDATLSGYPLVNDNATPALRVTGSIAQELRTFPVEPVFVRPACPAATVIGEGANVFAALYTGSDAAQWSTSGCLQRADSDVFDADAVVLPAPNQSSVLLPPDAGDPAIDFAAAEACLPVDQRGAPRPQVGVAGGPLRCDAGAYETGINPYRGIWSPARSGHGVDIQTLGNRLFLAWYTYADDGQPTAYQAVAPFTGPHWTATLQQSRRDPQSGAVSVSNVGTVTLDFTSNTSATLGWRFDARGTNGSESITASLFAPGEPRFEVTGLWYPPLDSGYGATVSRRGEVTAIGVYYYDAQGNVRWALGTANAADALELSMTSFTGFCPDCNAATMPVVGHAAGTVLAHFQTPDQARFDMQLTYPGAAGGTWNRNLARFVPLNDLVDNRDALGPVGSVARRRQ